MKLRSALFLICIVGIKFNGLCQDSSNTSRDMRLVSGATFRMGTDTSELESIRKKMGLSDVGPLLNEIPSFLVKVKDFYMDTVDVTNRRFAEFVESDPQWSRENADRSLHNGRYLEHWIDSAPPADLLEHPVIFVTWYVAKAYCQWRGKRLPTEAEYEWASQEGDGTGEFPWGNALPTNEVVNWGGNDIDMTVPVGSYPPNSRGLYDMSGNVWHFVSDPWLGAYGQMDSTSYKVSNKDIRIRRVVRGGSWGANAANLRVRYRDSHRPFDAREMVGFRCALSARE